ncbi:MAG: hypothetical protein KAV87_08080 [Desulfobacteraceae bacterium]|nr:hypothetical protein [Desulfobacteraceae bacterium]
MKSPAYWNSACYEFFIKFIWRKKKSQLIQQWKATLEWVPRGSQVVEVAAGTGRFYRKVLCGYVSSYLALEINLSFVKNMKSRGINAIQADVRKEPIPIADIVIIISSLYHFKNIGTGFLNKLLAAARQRVVIVEPVSRPLSTRFLYDKIRAKLTDIGEGPIFQRYSVNELLGLCNRLAKIEHCAALAGNEYLIVLRGRATGNDA